MRGMKGAVSTSTYGFHILAIVTMVIWGTTFISSKVLLNHGLTPSAIFFYRFVLAYASLLFFSHKRWWAQSVKDEVLLLLAGVTGGSLYFWFENTALTFTQASNVSLILSVAPILTTLVHKLLDRHEPLGRHMVSGSLIAFVGVSLVVYNDGVVLKLNPLGDFLSILAALMWAFYGNIMKRLTRRYDTLFITRKVFFYGLLTILPAFLFEPFVVSWSVLLEPIVGLNLLFLGLVASMLCFLAWNLATHKLGVLRVTNYIYLGPVVTLVASALLIQERITLVALAGCLLILGGVFMAERS